MANIKVSLFVPSMDKDGKVISAPVRETVLYDITSTLNDVFGGCTVIKGEGQYVTEANITIVENIDIVIVFAGETSLFIIEELAQELKITLRQESVLYTVEPVIVHFTD